MIEWLSRPWPWYVAGPLIGLIVPALLVAGGRLFGVSSNFRHLCAIAIPGRSEFFRYNWRRTGLWNLVFAAGILLGGFLAAHFLTPPDASVAISAATKTDLAALGITDYTGLVPRQLISWASLFTPRGMLLMVGGGFLVGFGRLALGRWLHVGPRHHRPGQLPAAFVDCRGRVLRRRLHRDVPAPAAALLRGRA
jgi:hypothetical protein